MSATVTISCIVMKPTAPVGVGLYLSITIDWGSAYTKWPATKKSPAAFDTTVPLPVATPNPTSRSISPPSPICDTVSVSPARKVGDDNGSPVNWPVSVYRIYKVVGSPVMLSAGITSRTSANTFDVFPYAWPPFNASYASSSRSVVIVT